MADTIKVTFANFVPYFVRFYLPSGEVKEFSKFENVGNEDLLVAAVAQFARDNYEKGGWDNVVECFESAEIARIIVAANARTIEAAIKAVGKVIGIIEDHRKDVLGYGGICTVCYSPDHSTESHPA